MPTKIDWVRNTNGSQGETWNPVRGCSPVSESCRNCYAARQAARFSGEGQPYEGLAAWLESIPVPGNGRPIWTGKVQLAEHVLEKPLRWRKPRMVFANSMGDLFHESLTDSEIDRVFTIMQACPLHTFQVLTKRPERALRWYGYAEIRCALAGERLAGERGWCHANEDRTWPLDNVWLGVSVENQRAADERIPLLLQISAALRFVSVEPMLGPIDIAEWLPGDPLWRTAYHHLHRGVHDCSGPYCEVCKVDFEQDHLDWIVCGCESGPGARPMSEDWARSLRDQCQEAGVPFFLKQLRRNGRLVKLPELDGKVWDEMPRRPR